MLEAMRYLQDVLPPLPQLPDDDDIALLLLDYATLSGWGVVVVNCGE